MAKTVRFHHLDGKVHVEPLPRFASANGTDLNGAKAILDYWVRKRYIERRPDGGFDVKRKMSRRDPGTMAMLRSTGHKAPAVVRGPSFDKIIIDEAADLPATARGWHERALGSCTCPEAPSA